MGILDSAIVVSSEYDNPWKCYTAPSHIAGMYEKGRITSSLLRD